MSNQIGSSLDPDIAFLVARFAQLEQTLAAIGDRLGRLEQSVATLGQQAPELRDRMEEDMRRIESQVAEQSAALASSRTAVAQTDDLVERVVEALESLQSAVLDQPEAGAAGVN